MTTGSKRWWRAVGVAAVAGGVIGGWFGLARPQPAKADKTQDEETAWTRAATVTPPPAVAEVARGAEPAPLPDAVVPVGGMLPIPVPGTSGPVVPAIPASPPVLVPTAPLPVPPAIEPVTGPRASDAAFLATDKTPLPVVPALPPAELPPLPVPPKTPEVKPVAPAVDLVPVVPAAPALSVPPVPAAPAPVGPAPALPLLPALPSNTAEPPKAAPLPPPTPLVSPGGVTPMLPTPPAGMAIPSVGPVAPAVPVVPQPVEIAPSLPPVKPADPVQPMLPAKPDSDLKPSDPPITLNPTPPAVAPLAPVAPGATARETPGTVVDRPKPPEPTFSTTEKFVFPLPVKPVAPAPTVPAPRDDTMFNLTTTAAFAVLGGALLAAEKASALPTVPASPLITVPGALVKADDKAELDKLKADLKKSNEKIEELEKHVKRLTDLISGKREGGILVDPNAPGAVDDIKELKNKIAALEGELKALKTQTTVQKPAIVQPEAKPKGTVKIINEYPVEITMMINDKAPTYRVAPGAKLDIEIPAGEFTYQLLQSGAPATRSVIKDKETVTLRIK